MTRWDQTLQRELGPDFEARHDFTRPQPKFLYPDFPRLPKDSEVTQLTSRLLYPRHPDRVYLSSDLPRACRAWIDFCALKKGDLVALPDPCPDVFFEIAREHGLKTQALPRDPQELLACDLSKARAVMLSNPNLADGFDYPDTIYERILQSLLKNPQLQILSEESFGAFTFSTQAAPGTAGVLLGHERLSLTASVYPALSPQGPDLAWLLLPQPPACSRDPQLSDETLREAARAVLAFGSRQGGMISEFQRRLLAVHRGFRDMTDALKPHILSGRISVPLWPECGFHLCIDVSRILDEAKMDVESWALQLARRDGILVKPGSLFGQPHLIQICFAAPNQQLVEFGRNLCKSLNP